jgi:hypothetical protein
MFYRARIFAAMHKNFFGYRVPSLRSGQKTSYSYFNARNGSMFIARRAGMYDAIKPTAASRKATQMISQPLIFAHPSSFIHHSGSVGSLNSTVSLMLP